MAVANSQDFNLTGLPSLLWQFPDRDVCFRAEYSFLPECNVVTEPMLEFLNITNFDKYFQAYCLNPPDDSCSFGFCPNPDVASPAVRGSTYFTTIMSAVLVLYSPEEVASTFLSQLLNVYSLIIAALIAVINRNLTKPHTAVALGLACSPLSAYLIIYVLRALFGYNSRLNVVFGPGMWLPRLSVLLLLPVWLTLLVLAAKPNGAWRFQQSACDEIWAGHHILQSFFEPVFLVAKDKTILPLSGGILGLWLVAWLVAIYLRRKEIWKPGKGKFRPHRIWRKVVDNYPFIQFCTVVFLPHLAWIGNMEIGVLWLLEHEKFSFTYGQVLALLVTIPPLYQLILLMPRLFWWFVDLTWVRFITCRMHKPRHAPRHVRTTTDGSLSSGKSFDTLQGDIDFHDSLPLVESKGRASFSSGR
ncbi:hypothetical protein MKEN_00931600 [Mycena kentingensis (nom. inval.)]|nr:hypothetical protein MKEN_00931600 [Mycena kentingensis (nom. inval.)]